MNTNMTLETAKPSAAVLDLAAVKARQRGVWSSGDYAVIGTTLQIVGEALCETLDVRSGERVLDVAGGNGNAALAAARRGCEVVATDYVPALLERARARAAADGLALAIREADAEALPFPDASFDVVVSTFGVMFTADHERAAAELVRVCRPGGRIGLANWAPDGFIGRLFGVIGRHIPPPAGAPMPSEWGNEPRLRELLGSRVQQLECVRRTFSFRYRSADHWLDVFRTYYGPIHKAFAALDAAGRSALERDVRALLAEFDRGTGRGLVVPSTYLEAIATIS